MAPLPPPPTQSDDHRKAWLQAAGIPEPDWPVALELVHRESSWRPEAVNPSSGACGLAQALPCNKIPGDWKDPVNALTWMQGYVMARYKSWQNALQFHYINNWY